jgi:hypothetical protein
MLAANRTCGQQVSASCTYPRCIVSPGRSCRRRDLGRWAAVHASSNRRGGSSMGSSVRRKVPQCEGTKTHSAEPSTCATPRYAFVAFSGLICTGCMNHRGSYAPMGSIAASRGPNRREMSPNSGMEAGVPREEHARVAETYYPPASQRGISVPGITSREMLRRRAISRNAAEPPVLPPVHLGDFSRAAIPQKVTDTQRTDPGCFGITGDQPSHGSATRWVDGLNEPGGVACGGKYAYVADTNAHRIMTVDYGSGKLQELRLR